ncbi:MAG: hydroxymethylbilane synthase [Flavobacteriaceae bacterium]|nr:hydroxymethylbilane synthase [Flavobacteriaceae bacterium]
MDILKIGTRASELAVWQAKKVQKELENCNVKSVIIPIVSTGDQKLNQPIYKLGISGVFTKEIDIALINNKVDIAVHSLKDVPTVLPMGIVQSAVLKRASELDVLVLNNENHDENIIATGSLRRSSQWLNRYPNDSIVGIRGNVNTRIQKLKENKWKATILAKAGLDRLKIFSKNYKILEWMIPAPGQGAISIQNLKANKHITSILKNINHRETEICTNIEREFLNKLEGGCSAPIGAIAKINKDDLLFKGVLLSLDGKEKIEIIEKISTEKLKNSGKIFAQKILSIGGDKILKNINK